MALVRWVVLPNGKSPDSSLLAAAVSIHGRFAVSRRGVRRKPVCASHDARRGLIGSARRNQGIIPDLRRLWALRIFGLGREVFHRLEPSRARATRAVGSMPTRFLFAADPGRSLLDTLAALAPANPFATAADLAYRRPLRARPWALGVESDEQLVS